jgi:hypothetical protein
MDCKEPIVGWIPLQANNNALAGRFDLCAMHKEQFIQEEWSKGSIRDSRIVQNN